MALRAMWSGVLEVNTLFNVHVSVCKATEEYRGKDPLRELCSCCHKPFKRQAVCEAGRVRLTEEMKRNGETDNTTEMVRGVEGDDEQYVVLEDPTLKDIAAAGTSEAMPVAAVVPLQNVPTERGCGVFYLRANSKVKKSEKLVEVLCAALERSRQAIITKWAPRGRELLVAVYPKNGALVMQVLMYESEVRAPGEDCVIDSDGIADSETDVAVQVLAALPHEYDFTAAQDSSVAARQAAIDAARNGEPIAKNERAPEQADTGEDLMAALLAATQGTPVVKDTRPSETATNGAVPVAA